MRFNLQRLAGIGYAFQGDDQRLVRDDGNHHLYYLIFASKVPVAKRIMDSVYRRPDAAGQAQLGLRFDE